MRTLDDLNKEYHQLALTYGDLKLKALGLEKRYLELEKESLEIKLAQPQPDISTPPIEESKA